MEERIEERLNERAEQAAAEARQAATVQAQLKTYMLAGGTTAKVASETGVNRGQISSLLNYGKAPSDARLSLLSTWLERQGYGAQTAADAVTDEARHNPACVQIYPTADYKRLISWAGLVKSGRRIAALIGNPRTGKTTAMRAYCDRDMDAHYIECWSSMRVGSLLEILGREAGVALTGASVYERTQQLIRGLSGRTDVMYIFDEAEYLEKSNIEKLEILRKIWMNTGTPIILSGTKELERVLTRGRGADNRAQLYGRMWLATTNGMTEREASEMLEAYDIEAEAALALGRMATDTQHGGLGNMVETLTLCLGIAEYGQITKAILDNAMRYKLLYAGR